MKNNYTTIKLILSLLILCTAVVKAQSVKLTFANAENTNDGANDYYEADIMIETTGGMADFKVGSGQIYFNFNTAAFGENVKANGRFVMETPSNSLAGTTVFGGAANVYGPFIVNDNITSRVSTLFAQALSSGTIPTLNVTSTPTLLYHIKFTYIDVTKAPNVTFVETNAELSQAQDQFFTACGPFTSGFAVADCSSAENLGSQIFAAVFDSANADPVGETLSSKKIDVEGFGIYPNPVKDILFLNIPNDLSVEQVKVMNLQGNIVASYNVGNTTKINVSDLSTGVYILEVIADKGIITRKIIKD